jgi:LmbE family N-acetylglucosaminyl deacetylase
MPVAPARPTVVVVHAHPDDEAIFTGVTIRRLADLGCRVVLVTATAGEAGLGAAGDEPLAARRLRELEQSCSVLGVARLVLLGRRDSGLPGAAAGWHPRALRQARTARLAARVADVVTHEQATAVLHDDPIGIYGHPDHVAAHRVGGAAARQAGVAHYEVTVDSAHLHGRHDHLVMRAAAAVGRDSAGRPAGEITTVVTGTAAESAAKRAAMAAHRSQIPGTEVAIEHFTHYYGQEWLTRCGGAPHLEPLLADPGPTSPRPERTLLHAHR